MAGFPPFFGEKAVTYTGCWNNRQNALTLRNSIVKFNPDLIYLHYKEGYSCRKIEKSYLLHEG